MQRASLPTMTLRRWETLTILRDALRGAERYVEQHHDENDPPVYEVLNQLRHWRVEVEVAIDD